MTACLYADMIERQAAIRRPLLWISRKPLTYRQHLTDFSSAMKPVFELLDFSEIVTDIGRNMKLARAAKKWRQEDLSKASGASLQSIKNLEGGVNVEFMTFLKVAKALGMGRALWEACKPVPQTLDELDRIEHARSDGARVRFRR